VFGFNDFKIRQLHYYSDGHDFFSIFGKCAIQSRDKFREFFNRGKFAFWGELPLQGYRLLRCKIPAMEAFYFPSQYYRFNP